MRPFEAALKGSREIGFTIVSITFSLIAVFIPVLLMGGMVGRVFREFAVTIAVAIVVSGFVSLTLTPMLCARVLRSHHRGREAESSCCACSSGSSSGCSAPTNGRSTGCSPSSRSCWWSRSRPSSARSCSISSCRRASSRRRTPASSSVSPKARPTFRSGDVAASAQGRRRSCARIRRSPTSTPRSASAGPTRRQQRPHAGGAQAAQRARRSADDHCAPAPDRQRRAGMAFYFQLIQNINLGGRLAKSQYQYTLQSSDTETLYRLAPELRDKISQDRRPARRHDRPLRHQPAGDDRGRSREGGGLRASPSTRSGRNCSTPSARARSRRSTRPVNDYQVILETKPEFQVESG